MAGASHGLDFVQSDRQKMMRLKNYKECVPNGYRYLVPETGTDFVAWDIGSLFDLVRENLVKNGHLVPLDLQEKIEDQMCLSLPPGWCEYDNPNRVRPNTALTWADVRSGIQVFSDWMGKGLPYVSQEEANRRAKICGNCPLNVTVTGCSACHKLAAQVTANVSTPYDESLKACGACSCLLRAKVHFPLDILEKNTTNVARAVYPQVEWCWLNRSGGNYKP